MTAWERVSKAESILVEAASSAHAFKAKLASRKLAELRAQELMSTAALLRQYGGRIVRGS